MIVEIEYFAKLFCDRIGNNRWTGNPWIMTGAGFRGILYISDGKSL